jgi:hypothetical protein
MPLAAAFRSMLQEVTRLSLSYQVYGYPNVQGCLHPPNETNVAIMHP